VEITYENHNPKRIVSGVAKHSMMSGKSFAYYYLPVSATHMADVLAILTPLSGDADLYITLQQDVAFNGEMAWDLPEKNNFRY
jgi:hypothetical protein